MEFSLPVVFTIGPTDPKEDYQLFVNYARTVQDMPFESLYETVQGIVEGEARSLTSTLTVEEMFNARDRFKEAVFNQIQSDLNKLGLKIFNANIREMQDYDDQNKYFVYRRQRAIEMANNEARVQVAEAEKCGEIGVKERERDTRVSVSAMDTTAQIEENLRLQEVVQSEAALSEVRSASMLREQLAKIEAENAAQKREEVLRKEVELARAASEMEALRAKELTRTILESEQRITEAEAEARAIEMIAVANLTARQKEAEGIKAVLQGQAGGLAELLSACSDPDVLKFYLGMDNGLFEALAKEQAAALQGLQPKINIWRTGSGGGDDNPISPIVRALQSLAPVADGLASQSDASIPFWNAPSAGKDASEPTVTSTPASTSPSGKP